MVKPWGSFSDANGFVHNLFTFIYAWVVMLQLYNLNTIEHTRGFQFVLVMSYIGIVANYNLESYRMGIEFTMGAAFMIFIIVSFGVNVFLVQFAFLKLDFYNIFEYIMQINE